MRGNACSFSSFICARACCECVSCMCVSAGGCNDDGWRANEGLKQLCAVRVSAMLLRLESSYISSVVYPSAGPIPK